jgi:hypothetical protein
VRRGFVVRAAVAAVPAVPVVMMPGFCACGSGDEGKHREPEQDCE